MARESVSVNELLNVARRALDLDGLTGRDKALLWALVTAAIGNSTQNGPTRTVDLDVDETVEQYGRVPAHDLIAQFTTSFILGLPSFDEPGPDDGHPGKIHGVEVKAAVAARKVNMTKIGPRPKGKIGPERIPEPTPEPGPSEPPSEPAPGQSDGQ